MYIYFIDDNQCSRDNGGCDHICINMIPGYECSCEQGFRLGIDGHTCSGKCISLATHTLNDVYLLL